MHLNLLLSPSSVSVIAWSWGNLSAVAIRAAIAGHENQVKFISEPDHGMYEAINKGIRMATGDVIALCHSDDFMFAKETVSHVVKKMEETDCDFLYADGIFVNEQNTNKVVRKWIGGKYARWKVRCGLSLPALTDW